MINYIAETAFAFCVKCELICFHRENNLPVIKLGDTVVPWKSLVVYFGNHFVEDGKTLNAVNN